MIRADRLEKLAAFLDTLPKEKFDFDTVWESGDCGSVGCAIGWTPVVFPDLVRRLHPHSRYFYAGKYGKTERDYDELAMWLFSMPAVDSHALFTPGFASDAKAPGCRRLNSQASPKAVAKNIRRYIAANCSKIETVEVKQK